MGPATQPSKSSTRRGLLGVIVIGVVAIYLLGRGPSAPGSTTFVATARPSIAAATGQPAPAGPILTTAQQNARESAQSYLEYTAFSRSGLIDQLVYEKYTKADATIAVDSLHVDWREQAYKSAKSYLAYTSFSLSGLVDQLVYEGFSQADATYGASKAYSE
jgi:hypothetical protein